MGITPKDIEDQRKLLERAERIREAQEQQAERMRLRDTFAAAALTGLLFHNHEPPKPLRWWVEQAYDYADAMLRERARSYEKTDEKRRGLDTSGVTLTDAEREALWFAIAYAQNAGHECEATLRGLLERMQ